MTPVLSSRKYLNPDPRLHEVSLSSRRFIPSVKQESEEHVLLCEVDAGEVGAVGSPLRIDFHGRLLWGFWWVPWQFRYILGKLSTQVCPSRVHDR